MRAREPLRDHIVRNLKAAMSEMDPDFERVEFWAAALEGFVKPVPAYEGPDDEHLLQPGDGAHPGRTSAFARAFPDRR